MNKQKQIVIEIDSEGNCSIDGHEFHGTECAHFISEIESSLGQIISQKDKPEYNQRQTNSTRNRQLGGR